MERAAAEGWPRPRSGGLLIRLLGVPAGEDSAVPLWVSVSYPIFVPHFLHHSLCFMVYRPDSFLSVCIFRMFSLRFNNSGQGLSICCMLSPVYSQVFQGLLLDARHLLKWAVGVVSTGSGQGMTSGPLLAPEWWPSWVAGVRGLRRRLERRGREPMTRP